MMFCSAVGTSILYWSMIEWAYYVQTPPFGYAPLSGEAVGISLALSFFHWGMPPWSVYAVGAIPLAYRFYVRKKNDLSLQAACAGVIGEKRAAGWLGLVINTVFILGILGGLAITYGTGVPMLANNLDRLFGTGESLSVYLLLIALITAAVALAACTGLGRGMQRISKGAAYGSLLLCLLFFLLGDPLFAVKNSFQSLGIMLQNLIPLLTNLDAVTGGTFARDWTVFFWAWWITLAPWMWIFIARISRGRSVRAIVGAVVLAGFAGTVLFFGTISNYGIGAYLSGTIDAIRVLSGQGAGALISELTLSLPLGKAVLVLFILAALLMLVTTMSSAAYTLSAAATRGLLPDTEPTKGMRLFWALMLAVAPVCLLYAARGSGAVPLGGLQALLILAAVPVSVTVAFAMRSAMKWMREDFGDRSAAEIRAAFAGKE